MASMLPPEYVDLLREVTTIANLSSSPDEPIQLAAERISHLAQADVCHVYQITQSPEGSLEAFLWRSYHDHPELNRYRAQFTFNIGVGFLGTAVEEKRTIAWESVLDKVDDRSRKLIRDCDIRSVFGIPLMVGSDVVAIMEFFFIGAPRKLDPLFIEVLDQVGIQLGRVIERDRARSVQERQMRILIEQKWKLEKAVAIANMLREAVAVINEAPTTEEALQAVLRKICEISRSELGHVYLVEKGGSDQLLSTRIWHCTLPERFDRLRASREQFHFQPGAGIIGTAFERREPVFWSDLKQLIDKQTLEHARNAGIQAALAFPIFAGSDVVAVVELFSTSTDALGDPSIISALEQVGIHLGRVFERAQAQIELDEQRSMLVNHEKMVAMGEMASGIAHEINNPLTIIFGRAGILLDTIDERILDDELKKGLQDPCREIIKIAERVRQIIKGLRSFARDASRDPMVSAKLTEIIDETMMFCRKRLSNSDVKATIQVPAELSLDCRPTQISQVLLNLINNAADAIENLPDRWIRIEAIQSGDFVEITLTDSGQGIPPEARARIFRPFFTTKSAEKGTGLGLSISRKIIEQHGGNLTLDPVSPNTRFVIRVPLGLTSPSPAR